MNVTGKIKLNYTQEFRVACKINNLKQDELLQYFVNHVSFYAFIGGDMRAIYLWATTVCIDCKEKLGGTIKTISNPEIKEISLKYIKKLTALSIEPGLSKHLEAGKSIMLMKEWADEMMPLTDYPEYIYIEAEKVLKLTFDFNLLCRMNGFESESLLQYFIDNISLAKERAVNLFQMVKTDPSTAVLLMMANSNEIKNKILPQQDLYRKYGLLLLELDQQQKEESNLIKRINNYGIFYQEWFKAMNKNIN